ncbi:MAG: RIP metalloprotease RseP [Chitinophagia bacterium]|nr:RIP metalloprotease RseP [Chitinophagia bacterium]
MLTLLDINWNAVGLQAGQLILSLSILVILHELGHFIPAKIFGCRVEKFYLFFDPWFSLVKKKIGNTIYGIGWLPLGGYVKIAGMIDESMDKEQLKQPAQEWEFRSKPAWQRLIIMIGGVTVNVLLAFFIYSMILFKWGETKLPMQSLTNGVWIVDTVVNEVGLKNGDKILAVNDEPVQYFDKINASLMLGDHMTIERNGEKMDLAIPTNFIEKIVEKGRRSILLMPRVPCIVGEIGEGTAAATGGLKVGDRIVGIDSTEIRFFDQVKPTILNKAGDSIVLTVLREGQTISIPTKINADTSIGFFPTILSMDEMEKEGMYAFEHRSYSFFASFPAGVRKANEKLADYVSQFKKILNPSTGAYKGLGGFKSMGSIFPKYEWDWEAFWNITAFFSIVLAFMNLLPIPALDGGHVIFTIYEMITGRKPNEKFLEYAQIVGMVLLFGLMIYANANDWLGWGRNR